jgi:hypothetical protein
VAAGIVIGRLWDWPCCGAEAEAHQARRKIKPLRRAGEVELSAIAHEHAARHVTVPQHATPRKGRRSTVTGFAIVVGIALVYLLGRSHGARKTKETFRGFFSDDERMGGK